MCLKMKIIENTVKVICKKCNSKIEYNLVEDEKSGYINIDKNICICPVCKQTNKLYKHLIVCGDCGRKAGIKTELEKGSYYDDSEYYTGKIIVRCKNCNKILAKL